MNDNSGDIHPSVEKNAITRKGSKADSAEEEYLFVSAGIRERPGRIPLWLVLVAIGLLVWGIYYLAKYWNPSL